MFCDWMNALKIFDLSLDLLGQPLITYFERFRFIYDHCAYSCNLFIFGCMCYMLSVIIVRSSAYVVVVHVEGMC